VAVQDQNGQNQNNAQAAPNTNVKIASRGDAPTIGSGKVQIVEFSDFQCPYCKQFFSDDFNQIKTNYIDTGKVTFTFRHFPLPFHQNAQKAAEAAECANRQGQFWPYHEILFTKANGDGTGLEISSLKQYASDLGLNTAKFNSCLDNGEATDTVKKDAAEGAKDGVNGTPTIFVDGKMIVGAEPYANFAQEIDAALKK
jgi:protein-disulfide isomerase